VNKLYRDILLARAQATIAAAGAVAPLGHAGLKGQLREIVVRDLLRPLLPTDVGIGSGQVISAYEENSLQQDIVLYDRRVVPPVLFEQVSGVFPLESVLFTIEVKSCLTLEELRKTHDSAAHLATFHHVPGTDDSGMLRRGGPGGPIEHLIPCLVAFDSDLTSAGKTELERYQELLAGEAPAIRVISVVQRGFWFWADERWQNWLTRSPGDELLGLMATIINTYRRVASTRLRPDFRKYLQ
jgi:hypothetical protein